MTKRITKQKILKIVSSKLNLTKKHLAPIKKTPEIISVLGGRVKANVILQDLALNIKDRAMLLRLLSDQEDLALYYLKKYTDKKSLRKVRGAIKQKKAKIHLRKIGFSFLISGRDLLPIVTSKLKWVNGINKEVRKSFFAEKAQDFSTKAWLFLPEFIGPEVPAQRKLRQLLALLLFSDLRNIVIKDKSNYTKNLLKSARKLGKISVKLSARKKNAVFNAKPADLGNFKEIADQKSKVICIKEADVKFLRGYIAKAGGIKVNVPKNFNLNYIQSELVKASVRMELRNEADEEDVDRIRAVLK